ncbi:hypothetical protein VE23_25395 [Paenibacillus sp. D9]|nr:hypothetical protein VE23_25395 [Paenibacillus sp. D9]
MAYGDCRGAAGMAYKIPHKPQNRYSIFISDKPNLSFPEDTIYRRDRWTLAHEIAHIKMHAHYDWATTRSRPNDDEINNKLEVEANWFASRLLMPDYAFTSVLDLTPAAVVAKFDVNRSAAEKRLKNLDFKVRNRLTEEVALFFHWKHEELRDEPMPDNEIFMMEVAAATEVDEEVRFCSKCQGIMMRDMFGHICFICGQYEFLHTE